MAKTFSVTKTYRLMRSCRRDLGISWNLLVKSGKENQTERKRKADALPEEIRIAVCQQDNRETETVTAPTSLVLI